MGDVQFTSIRWTSVLAYVAGCLVAVLTAGSVLPGVTVAAPVPGIAALNGMIAAAVVHIVGYYALEKPGLLPAHEIPEDADRV